MASNVQIVLDPLAIARMTMPGGMVDFFIGRKAKTVAVVAQGLAPHDTGTLAASIKAKRVGFGWEVIADTPYSLAVHEGTRPHVIEPKHAKALRFPSKGGTIVYAKRVNHPGTKANPFLTTALESVIHF